MLFTNSVSALSFNDIIKEISVDLISIIETALNEFGEEYAVEVAKTFGYDFAKNFFENYIEIASEDYLLERILLSVIFPTNQNHYFEILRELPVVRDFEIEKQIEFLESKKEEIKTNYKINGKYDAQAWEIIEINTNRQILAYYSDQENLEELEKRRGLLTEATVIGLKIMPAYDSEEGLVTLDNITKKQIQKIPALQGSDFAKDPVRASALFVLDPESILYLKIIETEDGYWISVEEALAYGYNEDDVRRAKLAWKTAFFVADVKDVSNPNQKILEFIEIIEEINKEKEILFKN